MRLIADQIPPIGTLGLPLGTFAVIEGTEHRTSKSWGSDDFVIETINGIRPQHELRIQTSWPSQLPDKRTGKRRYVLHGYEIGKWEGQPDGLPDDETVGRTQGGRFVFQHEFQVVSVEKVDGVTVADAKPIDPKIPLAKPDFTKKIAATRPIGALGLPLGTYAKIHVLSPPPGQPTMEIPILVDTVNGQPVTPSRGITIPDFTLEMNQEAALNGYEIGVWNGIPSLPKSELPSKPQPNAQGDTSFRFINQFMVISVAKPAAPAPPH
jgi:hypothetical protein